MTRDYTVLSDNIIKHDGLEENMRKCLYAAEKHGIVFGQLIENKASLILAVKRYLPEYTAIDTAAISTAAAENKNPANDAEFAGHTINADCFMIKQRVIDIFGVPDIKNGDYRAALSEYCGKINKFGFSALTAHHALCSKEANDEKGKTEEVAAKSTKGIKSAKHEAGGIFIYEHLQTTRQNPLMRFLKVLDGEYYPKKRVLFDCAIMPNHHCGTSEVMIATFDAFYRLYKDKYDIYLLANHAAAEYHKLEERFGNVLYPDTITGVYHIGYTPNPYMTYDPQLMMNSHCLKIVELVHDIQMVRIGGHFPRDVKGDVELGINLSDGIIFVSRFSEDDFKAYYKHESFAAEKKLRVIYNAKTVTAPENSHTLPFDEYFLIVGNTYKHKAIREAMEAVEGMGHNFIIVGVEKTGKIKPNMYGYRSGRLFDDFINYLYANSKAVIFPSLYEGFGLPTLMGVGYGKKVIVYDNAINKELLDICSDYSGSMLFFDRFEQIREILENEDFSQKEDLPALSDSWERAAEQLETFFDEILTDPVDPDVLSRRLWIYRQIEEKRKDPSVKPQRFIDIWTLYFSGLKARIRRKHPRFFRFLRKIKNLLSPK